MATIPLPNMPQTPGSPGPVMQPQKRIQIDPSGAFAAAREANMQPLMPAGMFDNGAAGKAWGEALQTLGQTVAIIAQEERKIADTGALADGELKMRSAFAEYQNKLATQPDQTRWLSDWQAQIPALEKQVFEGLNLSRAAENQLRLRWAKFNGDAQIELSYAATKQTVSRAKQSVGNLVDAQRGEGNFTGAIETVRNMGLSAGMTPEEVDDIELDLIREEQKTKLDRLIASDPKGTSELLKSPEKWKEFGLNEATALAARGRAESAAALKENMAIQDYKTLVLQGNDPEQVLAAVASELTPLTHETLKQNIAKARTMNDPVKFEERHRQIAQYSAKADETGLQLTQMKTSISLDFDGPMEQELLGQLDKQAKKTEPADANDLTFTDALGEVDASLKAGDFGFYQYRFNGDYGNPNIFYDNKAGTWVRKRDQWETGPELVPIKLDQSDIIKLTNRDLKPGEIIEDVSRKSDAARRAGMIRTRLEKRRAEGAYKTPGEMIDDFRKMMASPAEGAAQSQLRMPNRGPEERPAQAPSPLLPPPNPQELYDLQAKYGINPDR